MTTKHTTKKKPGILSLIIPSLGLLCGIVILLANIYVKNTFMIVSAAIFVTIDTILLISNILDRR